MALPSVVYLLVLVTATFTMAQTPPAWLRDGHPDYFDCIQDCSIAMPWFKAHECQIECIYCCAAFWSWRFP